MSTATPVAAPPPPTSSRLSRLNQRRLANFRRNRRGYWSFWAFWAIFALSLPAEFIANDRPLIIRFDGSYYFPVVATHPETTFGGDFETEAEYRERDQERLDAQAKAGSLHAGREEFLPALEAFRSADRVAKEKKQ